MLAIDNDSRISYRGELNQRDVYELMRESSIIVLPTGLDDEVTENFGNIVVESFIAGRPVMVTKGLHWDQYGHSPAVIRFDADPQDVARAIKAFDSIQREDYELVAREAAKLSEVFHTSRAVPTLRRLFETNIPKKPTKSNMSGLRSSYNLDQED